MKALRQELEIAQSIVMAEPQALIAFEADGTPRLVNHVLDAKLGVPLKLRNLMRFASWMERGAALSLENRLKELKASGRPFEMTLKTLAGPHIEAEARASGSGYYLKFRDLAGRRVELANLLRQQRAANEELASQKALLDALPMPVWFRDPDGRLIWVNRAYVSAVEAARADEVLDQQRELLETRQRRAAETALAGGDTFRKRLQTVVAGERRSFDTIVVPVGRASAGAVIDIAPLENVQDELSRQMTGQARTLDRVSTAVAIFAADQRHELLQSGLPRHVGPGSGLAERQADARRAFRPFAAEAAIAGTARLPQMARKPAQADREHRSARGLVVFAEWPHRSMCLATGVPMAASPICSTRSPSASRWKAAITR